MCMLCVCMCLNNTISVLDKNENEVWILVPGTAHHPSRSHSENEDRHFQSKAILGVRFECLGIAVQPMVECGSIEDGVNHAESLVYVHFLFL